MGKVTSQNWPVFEQKSICGYDMEQETFSLNSHMLLFFELSGKKPEEK